MGNSGENSNFDAMLKSANLAEGFHLQINSPNSQKEIIGNDFAAVMQNFVQLKKQMMENPSSVLSATSPSQLPAKNDGIFLA